MLKRPIIKGISFTPLLYERFMGSFDAKRKALEFEKFYKGHRIHAKIASLNRSKAVLSKRLEKETSELYLKSGQASHELISLLKVPEECSENNSIKGRKEASRISKINKLISELVETDRKIGTLINQAEDIDHEMENKTLRNIRSYLHGASKVYGGVKGVDFSNEFNSVSSEFSKRHACEDSLRKSCLRFFEKELNTNEE
jgi:hypothetical protein